MFFEKLKRITPAKIKELIKILIEFYFRRGAIKRLKNNIKRCKTISDYVNLVFSFKFFNIRPFQVKEEISKLLEIVEREKPQTILEIGTAKGGTLFLFSQVAPPNATIMSIDLPGGEFGGGYPEWKIPLYKSFTKENQKIHLIRGDSHNQATLEKIKNILNGRKIDFLFIDGDHSYEGVKKDFEMYGPLVKKGGIVSFHDIATFGLKEYAGEVPKFWQEIKSNYDYREFVMDLKESNFGIGVLFI